MGKLEQRLKAKIDEEIKNGHVEYEHDMGVVSFEDALQYMNKKGAKVTLKPHKSK